MVKILLSHLYPECQLVDEKIAVELILVGPLITGADVNLAINVLVADGK
jgi:hypothetical protein